MEYSNTVEGFVEELRVKSFGAWRSFPKVLLDCTLTKARRVDCKEGLKKMQKQR